MLVTLSFHSINDNRRNIWGSKSFYLPFFFFPEKFPFFEDSLIVTGVKFNGEGDFQWANTANPPLYNKIGLHFSDFHSGCQVLLTHRSIFLHLSFMATIKCIKARQIFDSRGNPTVEVIILFWISFSISISVPIVRVFRVLDWICSCDRKRGLRFQIGGSLHD